MAFNKVTYKPGDVLTAEQMNEIQTELLLHKGKLDELGVAVDYVCNSSNNENGWAVQYWNSGKFEAWRAYDLTLGEARDRGEGLDTLRYEYKGTINLPFETTSNNLVFVTLRTGGEFVLAGVVNENNTPTAYILSPIPRASSVTANVHVIGKYK